MKTSAEVPAHGTSGEYLLACERLVTGRADRPLGRFDGIIRSGQSFSLVGPNGCGKTTFLKTLAGVIAPLDGQTRLHVERLHLVGHKLGLKEHLSVLQNLQNARELFGLPASPSRVDAALKKLRLRSLALRPVAELSAGQRRRAALARLDLVDAPLWLLDEPLAHLDRDSRNMLIEFCAAHAQRGGAVIMSTHDQTPFPELPVAWC